MNSCQAAARLVAQLIAEGLRDVVLCPGSRSAPLAYALYRAEQSGLIRLHVRHDERTAAFLALGLSLADRRRPAAVVTTSGTAVANLLPAALEARHAGVRLLLLTADRPARLRGSWANQTSDLQAGLLGAVPVLSRDVEPAALGDAALADLAVTAATAATATTAVDGPVHLNLCFDDPLQPAPGEQVPLPEPIAPKQPMQPMEPSTNGYRDAQPAYALAVDLRRAVVVAGAGGSAARRFAEKHALPLLAEPSSGARGGANLVPAYRQVLQDPALRSEVDTVLAFGRPTLSRPVNQLLEDPSVRVVLVAEPGTPGPARPFEYAETVTGTLTGTVTGTRPVDAQWLARWQAAGVRRADHIRRTLADWPTLTGPTIAAEVVAATTSSQALVFGASNPIRDADLAAGPIADGALVFANRGLAGIDGTVGTTLGVALGTGRPTRALLGDLTLLHDLGGLIVPRVERDRYRVQFVVVNDGGGGIFATLEHGAHPDSFERVFGTPQDVDLAATCAGLRVAHRSVGDRDALRAALAEPVDGVQVLEVVTDRADLRSLHQQLAAG